MNFSFSSANATSLIDHFVIDECLSNLVTDYFCFQRGDNLSDHSPIVLRLRLAQELETCTESPREAGVRLSWQKATDNDIADYRQVLSFLLNDINAPDNPLMCRNGICCEQSLHKHEIEMYALTLSSACLAAAEACIPRAKKKKRIAGWSEHVQRFKATSILWHRIWEQCGHPEEG